jgi:hypothetical protein
MSAHFSAWIYGEVQGNDPGSGTTNAYARTIDYNAAQQGIKSFPAVGTVFHPLSPVVSIGGVNCAAIVEVLPQGLNVHGRKYATVSDVGTLNSAAG